MEENKKNKEEITEETKKNKEPVDQAPVDQFGNIIALTNKVYDDSIKKFGSWAKFENHYNEKIKNLEEKLSNFVDNNSTNKKEEKINIMKEIRDQI